MWKEPKGTAQGKETDSVAPVARLMIAGTRLSPDEMTAPHTAILSEWREEVFNIKAHDPLASKRARAARTNHMLSSFYQLPAVPDG